MRIRFAFAFGVLCGVAVRGTLGADIVPGIEELYRLDRLPAFKQSVHVASQSSYDRTGGNNDGFGGEYSYVRKEDGGLVLVDLKGPGFEKRSLSAQQPGRYSNDSKEKP